MAWSTVAVLYVAVDTCSPRPDSFSSLSHMLEDTLYKAHDRKAVHVVGMSSSMQGK